MKIQASLKVLPKANTRESSYKLVDEALLLIVNSGLSYEIGTSETTVEGEYSDVFELIEQIFTHYVNNDVEFSFFLNSEYNLDNFYIDGKKDNIDEIIK